MRLRAICCYSVLYHISLAVCINDATVCMNGMSLGNRPSLDSDTNS